MKRLSAPALRDDPARRLLEAAPGHLEGRKERSILGTLLYHGVRQVVLCLLPLPDRQGCQGVMQFVGRGKPVAAFELES